MSSYRFSWHQRITNLSHEYRTARTVIEVCELRNYWAHESDTKPGPIAIDEARTRLQFYLRELEDEW